MKLQVWGCLKIERFFMNKGTLTSSKEEETKPWSLELNVKNKKCFSNTWSLTGFSRLCNFALLVVIHIRKSCIKQSMWVIWKWCASRTDEKVASSINRKMKLSYLYEDWLSGNSKGVWVSFHAMVPVCICVQQSEFMGNSQALTWLIIYQESRQQCSHFFESTLCDPITSWNQGFTLILSINLTRRQLDSRFIEKNMSITRTVLFDYLKILAPSFYLPSYLFALFVTRLCLHSHHHYLGL